MQYFVLFPERGNEDRSFNNENWSQNRNLIHYQLAYSKSLSLSHDGLNVKET